MKIFLVHDDRKLMNVKDGSIPLIAKNNGEYVKRKNNDCWIRGKKNARCIRCDDAGGGDRGVQKPAKNCLLSSLGIHCSFSPKRISAAN